ncbi:unnamed protein product [Rotaria sordida]|uniref:Uncharacterized protein n=1 Tax=Rotaria sordida TaxID=392033 RepID=A0A814BZC6_9BILA|nr:unnamed protein product [Rotaria sordida]CAF0935576.1 unnamed protein product [Rotaria sordida]CAF3691891.1 unnamed protein product [Rotaria sordida]
MYGKCNDVLNAENIFETIENSTIIHYNSLLKVYNNNKITIHLDNHFILQINFINALGKYGDIITGK